MLWTNSQNEKIRICKMSDEHLKNTIIYFIKHNKINSKFDALVYEFKDRVIEAGDNIDEDFPFTTNELF